MASTISPLSLYPDAQQRRHRRSSEEGEARSLSPPLLRRWAAHASRFLPEGRPAARQPCGRAARGLGSRPSSLGSLRAVMSGPNLERRAAVAKPKVTILTLFGNLGGTSEDAPIPAHSGAVSLAAMKNRRRLP
jgi:hypothetical protein